MISRISTATLSQSVSLMLAKQAELSQTQTQLATGLKLNTAKDNPVGAGVAVALDRAEAQMVQFGENATLLTNRLSLEESVLTGVNDILARLREIAVQANGGGLGLSDRRAFLPEIAELRQALVSAANSTDAQGRYLFGGNNDGSPPFLELPGGIAYVGDQGGRRIEVAPEIAIADTDAGSDVFLRIRNGNGVFAVGADAGNAGNAALRSTGFVDQRLWDNASYRVELAAGQYTVLDSGNNSIATGAYVPGQSIGFRGIQITLEGQPEDGDAFRVGPAVNQDIFATVDGLVAALSTPDTPNANQALKQNRFFDSLQALAQASDHFIDTRASLGARLASIDRAGAEREASLLNTRTALSELRDLDFAEAISRLTRQAAALEAAQLAFTRTQSQSLFSLLR
ncbi:MAG: flagellar hook-associated protein FlgL [Xanthomonadaceae bacterium]|nr:flagellar hook-associated protein FlgL [Xanthomonadaceae bacterium]